MMSLRKIFKDYEDFGDFHAIVGVQTVIADGVFGTKSGDLVMILRVRGVDYECLDRDQVDFVARRFESAIRLFDERFRLYQYVLKRANPPLPSQHYANRVIEEATDRRRRYLQTKADRLYSLDTYLAVEYESGRPQRDLGSWLKTAIARPKTAVCQALSAQATLEGL